MCIVCYGVPAVAITTRQHLPFFSSTSLLATHHCSYLRSYSHDNIWETTEAMIERSWVPTWFPILALDCLCPVSSVEIIQLAPFKTTLIWHFCYSHRVHLQTNIAHSKSKPLVTWMRLDSAEGYGHNNMTLSWGIKTSGSGDCDDFPTVGE